MMMLSSLLGRFGSTPLRMVSRGALATAAALSILAAAGAPLAGQQSDDADTYILPPDRVQEIFATDKNFATLDQVGPDGNHFFVPHLTELSTLAQVGKPTLRLGELELRAETDRPWHLDVYGIDGLQTYSLSERRFSSVDLPEGALISDLMWSPDGSRIAFLAHLSDRTEVWSADAATGDAGRFGRRGDDGHVISTLGTDSRGQGSRASRMLQWTPDGSLITLVVPQNRGAAPVRASVPAGPTVRRTRAAEVPNPTYPNLLREPHDADLFEYYTTSQIAEIREGQRPRVIGQPGMYESISLSPDGRYILATRITRPFSFIAPYRNFPRVTEVLDRTGTLIATVNERELREGRTRGAGAAANGPRAWSWHPDGSSLVYAQRAPRSDDADAVRPDRIYRLSAPFDLEGAVVVAESDDPIGSFVFSADGAHLFAEVSKDGEDGIAYWATSGGTANRQMLVDWYDPDDMFELPGELWTTRTGNGIEVARLTSDGRSVFLTGPGYAADLKPQPFVDRVALADGATSRLFEGGKDMFERPLVLLDDGARFVVRREGVNTFPDSYLWSGDGGWTNLTNNVDPFPDVTAAKRLDFEYERRDGLKIRGRISLPVDYVEGTKVPAIFWTYPREYRSEEAFENATIRSRNLNAFTAMSWLRWSDIWLTQGYALIYPDIPIVGENYNDFYISNMVDAMYGAVREVDRMGVIDIDRIGHGGHSYGAFATANFLAHTPFFKAGIAGDGAYNRSLTPQGFQAEPRNIWEAPHVYIEMSPFFKADQINTPLLMYHGADDNNTGTFPIQSQRMLQALQGLGKNAVLYEYPFESHTPRALENNLDMWARWLAWFDRYVKGEEQRPVVGANETHF